eukprot:TRINITY_DN1402_c0_g1_i1.p1 TRINITY_DN1402_c0_g1~~TRINITY_DN1402_c0_g1_i1.p1  ORF type:complete len:174 (-),score=17.98 TRINITY_DN1402_c0_g1_i1:2-523(-)
MHTMYSSERRWWDKVGEGPLLLGALPMQSHLPLLKQEGVKAVVTLNEEWEVYLHSADYAREGMEHLHLPTKDYHCAPSPAAIDAGVKFLEDRLPLGVGCYVHCKAGRGRSTTLVICYLMKSRGLSASQALESVRQQRPHISLGRTQWAAVLDYERKLSTDRSSAAASSSQSSS